MTESSMDEVMMSSDESSEFEMLNPCKVVTPRQELNGWCGCNNDAIQPHTYQIEDLYAKPKSKPAHKRNNFSEQVSSRINISPVIVPF